LGWGIWAEIHMSLYRKSENGNPTPVGMVRVWNDIIRVWNGIIRVWNGIIRVWNGIIRVWNGSKMKDEKSDSIGNENDKSDHKENGTDD